jgi:hypothetical protein
LSGRRPWQVRQLIEAGAEVVIFDLNPPGSSPAEVR